MIAVIADDITGAAEVAGIAHGMGLEVCLDMNPCAVDCDVLVVATDTRSMDEGEAVEETRRVVSRLERIPEVEHIFKKTDSALRGHVMAELETLLKYTSYSDALYLPANPSKGRIIRDGVYYVGNTPLDKTDFSFDPEFPAFSAVLDERLPVCAEKGIRYTDAASSDDIRRVVEAASPHTLMAGAADLFTAYIRRFCPLGRKRDNGQHSSPVTDDMIVVCGSTQSKPIISGDTPTYNMPRDVYDGMAGPESWIAGLTERYREKHAVILAIADHHRSGKESAVYLRETIASVVNSLVATHMPRELIIEGGATAFAILRRLGWDRFTITEAIAPGVIRMRCANGVHITLKPGSYPWGGLF